ncbi:S-layer homology domain-containing protein [Paenibacillus sp. FSL H8-0034]|uniref:S-layer homology domain-containing protein n=1 Tax=Paenibacillus sp. FSL H8-0034 TaxID=2954671 RepID=UPI0030F8190C
MKKIMIAVATAAALLVVAGNESLAAKDFTDTVNHWSQPSIRTAVDTGYVDGYPDGTFKPDGAVTRAEFIKMVATAIGKKVTPEQSNLWYLPYVKALQDDGILSETFYSDDMAYPMVRSEMAMVATKAADTKSAAAMEDAVKLGLIGGVGGGELDEKGNTTRAQAVTIIERILSKRAGKELPVDEAALDMATINKIGTNIERVWKIKPVALPVEGHWGNGVTIKVNKVVMLEYNKGADQPYGYLFDGYNPNSRMDLTKFVTIAFQIDIVVDGTDNGVYAYRDFFKPDTLVEYGNVNFRANLNPTGNVAGLDTGKPGTYSGWTGYAVAKSIKQAQFADRGKSQPLIMTIGNNSVTIAE